MKKLLIYAGGAVGLAGAALMTTGAAFAANASNAGNGYGYTSQLETKAQALNMTADQLREQLKTQTLYQIAADKGVSVDALQARVAEQARERWQAAGLTQEQIQERETAMAERQANCDGTGSMARNGDGQGQGQGQQMRQHAFND